MEFVRAGGDLCLVCHREDYVTQAYEELVKAGESEKQFSKRVTESARRIAVFKQRRITTLRAGREPSAATIGKLSRRLWEFSEQVRLEPLSRREDRQSRG